MSDCRFGVSPVNYPYLDPELCQGALLSGGQSGLNLLRHPGISSKQDSIDIDISVGGVLKLLQGLNPSKAAGPDTIKPVVLKEIANKIVTAFFNYPWIPTQSHLNGNRH